MRYGCTTGVLRSKINMSILSIFWGYFLEWEGRKSTYIFLMNRVFFRGIMCVAEQKFANGYEVHPQHFKQLGNGLNYPSNLYAQLHKAARSVRRKFGTTIGV
jgi:hypothetical protein